MYQIELKSSIYKLTFSGVLSPDDMKNWLNESKQQLASAPTKFGVFVDMRDMKPLSEDSQQYMKEGQAAFKSKGMVRSVVILNDTVTTMQFKRIARETGIDSWERYIDASRNPEWKKAGLDWLVNGLDPDA